MSNQSLPLDLDAAEPDDVVLRRLARALDYAEGFWLGFAKCNSPAQRSKLVEDCRALLDALKIRLLEIELTEPVTDLLPVIREHLARANDEGNSTAAPQADKLAIFVYGLEHSIPSREAYPPLLSSLNLNRELFRQQLPRPLALWLPDYALTALARKAPDFWAWRSGLYEFAPARALADQSLAAVRAQATHVIESLSRQAKRERLTMLRGLLEDYRELGDGPREQGTRADILYDIGLVHYTLGEWFEARQAVETSRAIYRELNNGWGEAATLHALGVLARDAGEVEEARRLYGESLEIGKRLGYQYGVAITLHDMAVLAQDAGEVEEARRLYGESLEIKQQLGYQHGIAVTLWYMGWLAEKEGDTGAAAQSYREALRIFERLESSYAELVRGYLERVESEAS